VNFLWESESPLCCTSSHQPEAWGPLDAPGHSGCSPLQVSFLFFCWLPRRCDSVRGHWNLSFDCLFLLSAC
jgi:hypothetical protein